MKGKWLVIILLVGLMLAMASCSSTDADAEAQAEQEAAEQARIEQLQQEAAEEEARRQALEEQQKEAERLAELERERREQLEAEKLRQDEEMARLEEEKRRQEEELRQLQMELQDQANNVQPFVEAPSESDMNSNELFELKTVYFDFDESNIKDQFRDDLRANFNWIQTNPNVTIQLEGHADERGTNEYNLALGERRAKSVLNFLIALGANPEQFRIISFGEERPAVPQSTEEAYSKNRRVVFTRLDQPISG